MAKNKGIYHAPWEKSFERILTPLEEIIDRIEATLSDSGIQGSVNIGPPPPGNTSLHVGITGPAATLVKYRDIFASDL